MAVPKQWKYIAFYMVLVYLVFIGAIQLAKHEVLEDEKRAAAEKPL